MYHTCSSKPVECVALQSNGNGLSATRRGFCSLVIIFFASFAICSRAALADDDDIVNSSGFETPFTTTFGGTGQLEGQVNPPGEGQVLSPGQWLRAPATGASTARVQSAVVEPSAGVQAVRVD